MTRPHRVTSTDVAQAAGVSRTTVSYVLNGRGDLPAATRERVLAAAAELGYVPSASARALRRGVSDLVLVVQPQWTQAYTTGLILRRLTERMTGLGLWLVQTQADPADERIWSAITPLAVLSLDRLPQRVVDRLHRAGCPHVIDPARALGDLRAQAAHHGGLQADHLIRAGHVRLGYAAATDPTLTWFSDARSAGAARASRAAGLAEPVMASVGTDPELAATAVHRWRAAGVTAVAAYNDDVALAVMAAARRHGVTCPDDLAVIGIDNTPAGQCAEPSLSSIDTAPEVFADHLADELAHALGQDGVRPVDLRTAVRIVARESA